MTLDYFKLLTKTEQGEIVVSHGIFLLNYLQGEFTCDLYKLHDFFVKFCYGATGDAKRSIVAFAEEEGFALYKNDLSYS